MPNQQTTPVPLTCMRYPAVDGHVLVLAVFHFRWGDDGWMLWDGTRQADIKKHDTYVKHSTPQEQAQIDSVLASIIDIQAVHPHDDARLELRPGNAQNADLRIERTDHYVEI